MNVRGSQPSGPQTVCVPVSSVPRKWEWLTVVSTQSEQARAEPAGGAVLGAVMKSKMRKGGRHMRDAGPASNVATALRLCLGRTCYLTSEAAIRSPGSGGIGLDM